MKLTIESLLKHGSKAASAAMFVASMPVALMAQDDKAAATVSPVVVELYTSQGCSSCPPADALLTELAKRDDVLALALHVDYWDYIGWKDSFADPKHADRQRAYATALGERMIYTPQIVVQGAKHVTGYKPQPLAEAIERGRAASAQVPVSLAASRTDDSLHVTIEALGDLPEQMHLQLVEFDEQSTVEITHGENRGKTILYSNIVTEWTPIAKWSGDALLDIEVPVETDGALAVILQEFQEAGPGMVLAAKRIP